MTSLLTSTADDSGAASGVAVGCAPTANGCTACGHDAHGNVTFSTDPLGHTTSVGFDANGNVHHLLRPGDPTLRGFDDAERLKTVTDTAGQRWSW